MLIRLLFFLFLPFLLACGQRTTEIPYSSNEAQSPSQIPGGVTLIQEFAGEKDDFSIPFGKYQLDNGLTVILHEDHSHPLVHVEVTYHVGSNREEPGRSGFAHFFEHMMFEGSTHVGQGEFSKILSDAGGSLNGTTDSDRTSYFESVPVNQLEIALWLEADRMGLLLGAVDQEKFEIQRETVKNERGQRIDNQPYGRISEIMMKTLYPAGHPYSWPVIGWTEDLDAANVDDLKRFFLRWYAPNNATLTIGGDLDKLQTLEWIVKYFGPIPRGPEVEKLDKSPAEIPSDRYVTLEDNIHLPAIAMLFPTVYYAHADEAPLDAVTKIMGKGRASLLYQRLVQSGRAVSAHVSHACRELACEMAFIVVQNPASGESLEDMEQAIRETLLEFADREITDDDLQKFSTGFESSRIFGMQSVAGKVGALAFSEVYNGDPKTVMDDLERYSSVTREDVARVFKQYIEDKPAVILSVVPNGQPGLAARAQNYPHIVHGSENSSSTSQPNQTQGAPALRNFQDDFDRSIQPIPGNNPVVNLPPILDTQLANGARILAVRNTETPTTAINAVFAVGQRDEPQGKAGLASMTAAMMQEATQHYSAAEFSEALERIGASVYVSSSQYTTTVSLNLLSKHLDEGMALMMERMLQPAFTPDDFDRLKSRRLESLTQAQKSGPALAGRAINAVLSGSDHPLSYPGAGLPSTVENISLEDVTAFYAAHFPAHFKGVLISTDLSEEETLRSVQGLAELEISETGREPVVATPEIIGRTIYLVDKKNAAQSSLRLAHPSIKYDALGDYYRASLMNFNLGGTFDSRINLNLREDKGYTYGARSGFSGGLELGRFSVSSEVKKEATAASIIEIFNELENYSSNGMTPDEYRFMQNAISNRDALSYETPGSQLGLLSMVMHYELPLDYRIKQQSLLNESDRETLNALAGKLIDPDRLAIVVVGDSKAIRPQLDPLGITIKLLNEEGELID
jgi:zinc protease